MFSLYLPSRFLLLGSFFYLCFIALQGLGLILTLQESGLYEQYTRKSTPLIKQNGDLCRVALH